MAIDSYLRFDNAVAGLPTKPLSLLSPNMIVGYSKQNPTSCATADFNGDGRPDLVVYTPSNGSTVNYDLSIFPGNGDGTFQSPLTTQVGNRAAYFEIADFNGDGKPDVGVLTYVASVTGQYTADYQVLLGHGDGTFLAPIHNQLPNLARIPPVLVADFNRDGKADLLAPAATGSGMNFYPGKGDGTFGLPANDPLNPITSADFNGDGIPDILGYSLATSQVAVYLGNGDGTFDSGHSIVQPIPTNSLGGIVTGDVNNDGKQDLILSGAGPGISAFVQPFVQLAVLLGNGDGTFQAAKISTSTIAGGVADMNRDGNLDLLSDSSICLGNGDGTFQSPVFFQIPIATCQVNSAGNCNGGAFSFPVDLNGDGLPDLITTFSRSPGPIVSVTLLSFINDSPGDGFLVPGALAPTGAVPVGLNSILTAYGVNLAPVTASAVGAPYPTSLGGIELNVGGNLAPLLYVSPTQINDLMPQLSATSGELPMSLPVSIQRAGEPFVPKGLALQTMLDTPGIFTANAAGLAAATAVRVAPDGTQTPVPVFTCTASGCTAVPIDTSGGPIYLSLYGTGMTYIPNNPPLTGGIGLQTPHPGQITYAGPQGVIPGLQQINILLNAAFTPGVPSSIPIQIKLGVDYGDFAFSLTSNTVYVTIM